MSLAFPEALWALLLVPALVIALALDGQKRRRVMDRIGHLPQIQRMAASVSVARRRLKGFVLVLAVASIVGALSRPQLLGGAQLLPRRGLDLVVALDFSRSMLAADVYPSRLERAKLELSQLIDGLRGDRVGLVAFAGVTLAYPLTSDYGAAKLFWRDLGPDDIPVGGTNLGLALSESIELLSHASGKGDKAAEGKPARRPAQVIVLLTDGSDTEGSPLEAAREAARLGMKVFAVGIGSKAGEFVSSHKAGDGTVEYIKDRNGQPVRMALDEATLRQVAQITGGEYFQVEPERMGVERVQRAIAALERTEEEARVVREPQEAFAWFLLPALFLLVMELFLDERRKGMRRPLWGSAAVREETRAPVPAAATDGRGPKRWGPPRAGGGALALLLLGALPGLVGWSWFERPSPDVVEGNRKLAEGKADDALTAYDRAVESRPDDAAAHYDRGNALFTLGRFPEAQREFERATEAHDPGLKADGYYNLGNALLKQSRTREAADAYKRVLRLRPDDRRAKWNLELAQRKLEEQQKQPQSGQDDNQKKDQKDDQKKDSQSQKSQQQQQQQENKDQQDQKDKQQQAQEQKQNGAPDQARKDPKDPKDQQAQKQDDPQEQKPQEQKSGHPEKAPKDPSKDPGQAQAAAGEARPVREIDRQDAEAVLDAFERVEPTVQKDLARRKAGDRKPRKDW